MWESKIQARNVVSTTEAEFVSIASTAKRILCLRDLTRELGLPLEQPTTLNCDNKGAVQIAKNDAGAQRTRHLGAQLYFVKDNQNKKHIDATWIEGKRQLADMLTKPLSRGHSISNRNRIMTLFLISAIIQCLVWPTGETQLLLEPTSTITWVKTSNTAQLGTQKIVLNLDIPSRCKMYYNKTMQMVNHSDYGKTITKRLMMKYEDMETYNVKPYLYMLKAFRVKENHRISRSDNNPLNDNIFDTAEPREPGGWAKAGRMLMPLLDQNLEHSEEDSHYNVVANHHKQIKILRNVMINHTKMFEYIHNNTENNVYILDKLSRNANDISNRPMDVEKIWPILSDFSAETIAQIYADVQTFIDLRTLLEDRKVKSLVLHVIALAKYTWSTDPRLPSLTEHNDYIGSQIDLKEGEMVFTFSRRMIDGNSFIFRSLNFKKWLNDHVYQFPKDNYFAFYNSTTNCSTLIDKPSKLMYHGESNNEQRNHPMDRNLGHTSQ